MDYNFDQLESISKTIEKMIEPARKANEQWKAIEKVVEAARPVIPPMAVIESIKTIRNSIDDSYKEVFDKVERIMKPLSKIGNLTVSDYLSSYNETRELVNNFEEYAIVVSEEDSEELRVLKQMVGEMPDIEQEVKLFTADQSEEFKQNMDSAHKQIDDSKDKPKTDVLLSRTASALTIFVQGSDVPEAIEKYAVIIKSLYSIFIG